MAATPPGVLHRLDQSTSSENDDGATLGQGERNEQVRRHAGTTCGGASPAARLLTVVQDHFPENLGTSGRSMSHQRRQALRCGLPKCHTRHLLSN